MKKKIINSIFIALIMQITIPFSKAYSQSYAQQNFGVSVNVIGIIFGEYGLGINTFITPKIQIGVHSIYYETHDVFPEIEGWASEFRVNYFFAGWHRSGFYIGGAGGLESIHVKNDENSPWEDYSDPTWGVIPGYAWEINRAFTMMVGLRYGYKLGTTEFSPEVNFVMAI